MSILEANKGLVAALKDALAPKFLATVDKSGVPNVVPCLTLTTAPDAEDTLIFGNFLLRKSIKNLEQNPKVGVLVMTQALDGWVLTGDFVEFQRTGAYVDHLMSGDLLRYNAYTGVRNAGVIRVRGLDQPFKLAQWRVARDFFMTRLLSRRPAFDAGSVAIPDAARREFATLAALKAVAWVGEQGYPIVSPALSLQPVGPSGLAWRSTAALPSVGALAAANVLTMKAVSYQAKGRVERHGHTGVMQVQEVYAGGPPLPGARVA